MKTRRQLLPISLAPRELLVIDVLKLTGKRQPELEKVLREGLRQSAILGAFAAHAKILEVAAPVKGTEFLLMLTVAKLLAPFAPFFADRLYTDLTTATGRDNKSVHLAAFPKADYSLVDADLEARMAIAQKITSMVLALRRKVNIKVRQPLQAIMIPAASEDQKKHIEAVKELVMNEVNVKELRFVEGSGVLVKKVKCNFRTMGKKFGKLMKGIAAAMSALEQEQIADLEKNGTIALNVDGNDVVVEAANLVGMSNLFCGIWSARDQICNYFRPVSLSCIRTGPSEGTDAHAAYWHQPYTANHILLIINVLGIGSLSVEYANLIVQQVSAVGILEEITLKLQTDVTTVGSMLSGPVAEKNVRW